jgi:hypothetical protein
MNLKLASQVAPQSNATCLPHHLGPETTSKGQSLPPGELGRLVLVAAWQGWIVAAIGRCPVGSLVNSLCWHAWDECDRHDNPQTVVLRAYVLPWQAASYQVTSKQASCTSIEGQRCNLQARHFR